MGSKRPSPEPKPLRATPLRDSSIDNAALKPDTSEYADSPVRKRPRLDSTSLFLDTTSPTNNATAHIGEAEPTQNKSSTPSSHSTILIRATSNLRPEQKQTLTNGRSHPQPNPSNQGTEPQANPYIERRTVSVHSSPAVEESMDLTAESLHETPPSPPVVEIELGESEDLSDTADSGITIEQSWDDEGLRLLQRFPSINDREFAVSANRATTGGKEYLDITWLSQVGDWIQSWLALIKINPVQCHQIYADEPQFWTTLASTFAKLLNRRAGVWDERLRSVDTARVRIIHELFLAYFDLVQDMLQRDLRILRLYDADAENPKELCSTRHLKNLEAIFKPQTELVPFWKNLEYTQFNARNLQSAWALAIFNEPSELLIGLADAILLLCERVTKVSRLAQALSHSARCFQYLVTVICSQKCFRDVDKLPHTFVNLKNTSLNIADTLGLRLQQDLEKQSTVLSAEVMVTISTVIADLLHSIATLDSIGVQMLYPQEQEDINDISHQDMPRHLREHIHMSLLWKCVEKGRMELRIQALMSVSQGLVQLWKEMNNGSTASHPVLLGASRWLEKRNVLEYLMGIDSHPQLITHGRDVLGFLWVTDCWTSNMTDFFWSTILSHQDRRIAAAAIGMFNNFMSAAQPNSIDAFWQKLYDLPVNLWGPEMRSALRCLLDDAPWAHTTQARRTASGLCIHILQQSAKNMSEPPVNDNLEKLHTLASELLHHHSQRLLDQTEREDLYRICLKSINARSNVSLGSVEAVLAILESHVVEDLPLIGADTDICATLAEGLCSIVERSRGSGLPFVALPNGPSAYLKLLGLLVTNICTDTLHHELEAKMWEHLIGHEAVSDVIRNEAWQFLRDVVLRSGSNSNTFVDRLLETYLPSLPFAAFTHGLFQFMEAAVTYARSTYKHAVGSDNEVVDVPLTGMLWRMILECPEDAISDYCVALLSHHYLDSLVSCSVPQSNIAATFIHLVDQCIGQLLLATSDNISQQRNSTSEPCQISTIHSDNAQMNTYSPNPGVNQRHFIRTLRFMQRFLADVRGRPDFCRPYDEEGSPLITIGDGENESSVILKYQAFNAGRQGRIKELKLPTSTTLGDLTEHLRRLTGFSMITVINGGKVLDLVGNKDQSAADLNDKGLLIVRNVGNNEAVSFASDGAGSAAERAVLAQFDILYGFLDLPERLSTQVYLLMNDFQPHPRIYEVVMKDGGSNDQIFPSKRSLRMRTLYSIKSLARCLHEQLKSGQLEEEFILHGIRALTSAFTDDEFCSSYLTAPVDQEVVSQLAGCLLSFLKERPTQSTSSAYFTEEKRFANHVLAILQDVSSAPLSHLTSDAWILYALLVEAGFHSRKVWDAFQAEDCNLDIHYWLLVTNPVRACRERIRIIIDGACSSSSPSLAVGLDELAASYWQLLYPIISRSGRHYNQTKELFDVASAVFSSHGAAVADEATLRTYLDSWTTLIAEHAQVKSPSRPHEDEFVLGIVRLLRTCVSFLKSLKKPVGDHRLLHLIFDDYLFPPVNDEIERSTKNISDSPILDDLTRKELYNLSSSLIEDTDSYTWLIEKLSKVISQESQEDAVAWNMDRTRWLRSPTGYSGLRNLTNTCYMNSLLTQLFMNAPFRELLIQVASEDQGSSVESELLQETQVLFANMQNGNFKYTDTKGFAQAIKPYDSDHIDVTVQMDVDEFYNLLFDRWEGQMPTNEAKEKFRSFYGGQLVTQIKSADCDHISERLEPFFAIQCEVKGKSSLIESLKAYVEGDAMEGDNKYKCEACGGRLVNAMKRSCLSNIPNHLIFHLKRFDFDLATLQRSKINDDFQFPDQIDMTPYHVDYLRDAPGTTGPDMFDLCGVLVHNGTAETGHYYSYIRLPSADGAMGLWAEFNDIEVATFDPSRIPDQCFGGVWEQSGTEQRFPKSHNAYMLFYQRRPTSSRSNEMQHSQQSLGPVQNAIPLPLASNISRANELLLRRYCLYAPSHAQFVKSLISLLQNLQSASCTDDHRSETSTIAVIMEHLALIFARVKDTPEYEPAVHALKRMSASCGRCALAIIEWMLSQPEAMCRLLLQSPIAKVRTVWCDFMASVLQDLRKHDAQLYGIEPSNSNSEEPGNGTQAGAFQRIVRLLSTYFPNLWSYSRGWNEYFGLWTHLAESGLLEVGYILFDQIFGDSLELILVERERRPPILLQTVRNVDNRLFLMRTKKLPPFSGLVRFLYTVLCHLDLFSTKSTDSSSEDVPYDSISQKYIPMDNERDAILYQNPKTNQMPFVERLMEVMELESASGLWYPGEIISLLLEERPPGHIAKGVCHTICAGLRVWLPAYCAFLLKSAVYFCQSCPVVGEIRSVIRGVANNASAMAKHAEVRQNVLGLTSDFAAQGGQHHLEFFAKVVDNERTSAVISEEDVSPIEAAVISTAQTWGPPLLMFDDRAVREEAAELLCTLIFNRYPPDAEDGEVHPVAAIRTQTVRAIFPRCVDNLVQAQKMQMPRSVCKSTMSTMERCAVWLHQLRQDKLDQLRHADDDRTIASYHDIKRQVDGWADEEGDILSETEWASQFEDEDSDELTEA